MGLQYNPELPVNSQKPPNAEQGPRVVTTIFTYPTANTPIRDDLQLESMQNGINNIQTIWVDNNNNGTFQITFQQTQQTVRIGAFKQGFYPLLSMDGITYSTQHSLAGAVVVTNFCNFPMSYAEWNTNAANSIANTPPGAAGSPQTPLANSSGNVAATATTATLTGVAGKTTFVTGFEITGAGATSASVIIATLTGCVGGTLTYDIVVPAGVTTSITPLIVEFPEPLASSAVGGNIVINLPSFGTGNTNAAATIHGFAQ